MGGKIRQLQWRSQDFLMGGFSAGKSGNRGRARGRVREGVYPLLPGVQEDADAFSGVLGPFLDNIKTLTNLLYACKLC